MITISAKDLKTNEINKIVLENTNDLITILDKELKLEYINEATHLRILGYDNKDLIGKTPGFLVHPEEIKQLNGFLRKLVRQGSAVREGRLRTKEGLWIYFDMRGKLFESLDGERKALIISRDISQKKSEQLLLESEQNYRLITENANDLIRLLNSKFKIEYINPQAHLRLLGYGKEDIIGKSLKLFVHPEEANELDEVIRDLVKTGFAQREGRIKHKDGYWMWFDMRTKLFEDSAGKIKGVSFSRDITDKKKAEQRLIESEKKYRVITENANDMISIIDDKYRFEFANERVLMEVLGYKTEEILRKKVFKYIHPDDLEPAVKALSKGRVDGDNAQELRVKKKNGDYVWLEVRGRRYIDSNGNAKGILISHDISERKRTDLLIRKELQKLKELNQMRTDFVNRVSHELKTPLTTVHGACQLFNELYGDQIPKEALELVQIALKGGERLKALIYNILNIAKIEEGKLQINKKTEDLGEILINCIENFSYLIAVKNISIRIPSVEKCIVNIDKYQFEEVLNNVMDNAIKNTPKNGRIQCSLENGADEVKILIKDNGVGITELEMAKLFKKFGKIERINTHAEINIEGSGLGLFISKQIMEMHGGSISAYSEGKNKGALFEICLPIT